MLHSIIVPLGPWSREVEARLTSCRKQRDMFSGRLQDVSKFVDQVDRRFRLSFQVSLGRPLLLCVDVTSHTERSAQSK